MHLAPVALRILKTLVLSAGLVVLTSVASSASSLENELGRNEVRIRSGVYVLEPGRTVWQVDLAGRLNRLGYERVSEAPSAPGQYFWGKDRFVIFRRSHRWGGRDRAARLLTLSLRPSDGRILGALAPDGSPVALDRVEDAWLDPETIAEALDEKRAVREPFSLDQVPEHVWRPVLAAEDARFFDHAGVDARALARALLANVKAGETVQGGSTITQQLIKNRDLTPKRSVGRKASEAVRALALEAEYTKEEILEAYLNQVYLGHVDGLAIHGFGAAARAYFSKPVEELTLADSALLAAIIQGPNRLAPQRHPDRAGERRNWILGRMEELGWAAREEVREARQSEVRIDLSRPRRPPARQFRDSVATLVRDEFARGVAKGRGVVVETTLDPYLQTLAEEAVRGHLAGLRRDHPRLRGADLSAALLALDPSSGAVLAWVGGDPADRDDEFDRVRLARRQTGSVIKPLLLLEAFQSCGSMPPLHPSSRVADEPLRIDVPSGPWEPTNYDDRFRGVISVRESLRLSLNVPFVRIARWCGEDDVAGRVREAGLPIPEPPPPSFALGAVEATPLEVATAYTVFASPGKRLRPFAVTRIERPAGGTLMEDRPEADRVVSPATAWIAHDLLRDAVERGTGTAAAIEGVEVAGKTGTSSVWRDAWFVGDAEGLLTVVWVGLDGGGRLGLTGGRAAAPLWREFMGRAVTARPPRRMERPRNVVEVRVDPKTGLRVASDRRDAEMEYFRRNREPKRKRLWRRHQEVVW